MKYLVSLLLLLSSTTAFQTPSITRTPLKLHSAPPAVEETATADQQGPAALSRDRYVATNREFSCNIMLFQFLPFISLATHFSRVQMN
jgi:hypothetical protein